MNDDEWVSSTTQLCSLQLLNYIPKFPSHTRYLRIVIVNMIYKSPRTPGLGLPCFEQVRVVSAMSTAQNGFRALQTNIVPAWFGQRPYSCGITNPRSAAMQTGNVLKA